MPRFKIQYTNNRTEEIDADRYIDVDGRWIEFRDAQDVQLLRVLSAMVGRIETIKD